MYFHIADKTGKILLARSKAPYFLSKIRPADKDSEDFSIEIAVTNSPQYTLKIVSPKQAYLHISPAQNLPAYGYMTIFKAMLQALLLREGIILFHGIVDKKGTVFLNGSRMDWFDNLDTPSDVYGRLVIVKKQNGSYHIYSNFLREGFSPQPVPVTDVRFMGKNIPANSIDFLLQSTWYYLFFEHFHNQPDNFLPQLMTDRFRKLLGDFNGSLIKKG